MGYTTPPRRGNQVEIPRIRVTLRILHSLTSVKFFFPLLFCFNNNPHGFIWQTSTTHLVNFKDLNRILRLEIFLPKDGELRAAHVILGYKPSTKRS